MSRHILDRPRSGAGNRLEQFLALERASQPHPASRQLHQRKRNDKAPRLAIYTRIERRKEA